MNDGHQVLFYLCMQWRLPVGVFLGFCNFTFHLDYVSRTRQTPGTELAVIQRERLDSISEMSLCLLEDLSRN